MVGVSRMEVEGVALLHLLLILPFPLPPCSCRENKSGGEAEKTEEKKTTDMLAMRIEVDDSASPDVSSALPLDVADGAVNAAVVGPSQQQPEQQQGFSSSIPPPAVTPTITVQVAASSSSSVASF